MVQRVSARLAVASVVSVVFVSRSAAIAVVVGVVVIGVVVAAAAAAATTAFDLCIRWQQGCLVVQQIRKRHQRFTMPRVDIEST